MKLYVCFFKELVAIRDAFIWFEYDMYTFYPFDNVPEYKFERMFFSVLKPKLTQKLSGLLKG